MNQPLEGVDARTDRVAQGAVGVALLAVPLPRPGLFRATTPRVGALAAPQPGLHAIER